MDSNQQYNNTDMAFSGQPQYLNIQDEDLRQSH